MAEQGAAMTSRSSSWRDHPVGEERRAAGDPGRSSSTGPLTSSEQASPQDHRGAGSGVGVAAWN